MKKKKTVTRAGKNYRYRKVGTVETIPKRRGKKKITFKAGGLHRILGVPQGTKIPAAKMRAALAGKYGAKAKKEALFAKNVLRGRK